MIEDLVYVIAGFAVTYISLEVAWHFTACRIKDNSKIKTLYLQRDKDCIDSTSNTWR
jgi:hypothetical protein